MPASMAQCHACATTGQPSPETLKQYFWYPSGAAAGAVDQQEEGRVMFKSRSHRTLKIPGVIALAVGCGLAVAPTLPAAAVAKTPAIEARSQASPTAVPPYGGSTGKQAVVRRPAQTASDSQTVINFADLPNSAVVTNQYPGVVFSSTSGNVNYVSDQSSYDTPSFICTGPTGGNIDCTADTIVDFTNPVSGLTLDAVGVNNTGQVAEVKVYGASGLIATVPIIGDAGGYTAQLVDLSAYKAITSIDLTDITDAAGIGWTNFSFTPSPAFTVSGTATSTAGQAGKQDTGSAKDAKACETAIGQFIYKADEAEGKSIVATWQKTGLTTAADFLDDFLNGTGNAVNLTDTSQAAAEIKASSEFTAENKDILTYIGQQLAGGATNIQLPTPNPLQPLAFLSLVKEPDLYLALRRTNGISVSGNGSLDGQNYTGSLTYVITESYGFNEGNTLLGIGSDMRYLQTICGSPYYKDGAHWFPVSITVTVKFSIPS